MSDINENTHALVRKTMHYRYIIFGIAAMAYFLVFFHRNSIAVMIPELSVDFSINPAQAGLFGSMYFYAYAIAQLPSGLLADRWGPRKTTSVFLAIAGIGAILFSLSNSLNIALGARFLVGMGVAFIYISAMLLIAEWFKPNEYSRYIGFLIASGNLGSLAASAPLVALMAVLGWRNSMISIALFSFFIAALLYILIRNKPEEIGGANFNRYLESSSKPMPKIKITEGLKILLKKPEFWALALLMFGWAGTIFALQGLWLGPYLINVYHLSTQEAGNLLMIVAIGSIFGTPLIGLVADKTAVPKKTLLMAGAMIAIVLLALLIVFVDSMQLNILILFMLLFGFFGYACILEWPYLKEIVDIGIYGTASGLINFFGFLGGAVFQQVLGIIIAKAPVSNNYIAASGFKSAFVFCFFYLIIALVIFKRKAI